MPMDRRLTIFAPLVLLWVLLLDHPPTTAFITGCLAPTVYSRSIWSAPTYKRRALGSQFGSREGQGHKCISYLGRTGWTLTHDYRNTPTCRYSAVYRWSHRQAYARSNASGSS